MYTHCSERSCNQPPGYLVHIEHGYVGGPPDRYVLCENHIPKIKHGLFNGNYDWKTFEITELK